MPCQKTTQESRALHWGVGGIKFRQVTSSIVSESACLSVSQSVFSSSVMWIHVRMCVNAPSTWRRSLELFEVYADPTPRRMPVLHVTSSRHVIHFCNLDPYYVIVIAIASVGGAGAGASIGCVWVYVFVCWCFFFLQRKLSLFTLECLTFQIENQWYITVSIKHLAVIPRTRPSAPHGPLALF